MCAYEDIKDSLFFGIAHAGIQIYFLTPNKWSNWQSSQRGASPPVGSVFVYLESICIF